MVARMGDLPGGEIRWVGCAPPAGLGSPRGGSPAGELAVVELFGGLDQGSGNRRPGWEPTAALLGEPSVVAERASGGRRGGHELTRAQVQHVRAGRDLRYLVRRRCPTRTGRRRDR